MESSCRATSTRSRGAIEQAIRTARQELGAVGDPGLWLTKYYQLANRLAHLVWLKQQGVRAWLVVLLFLEDIDHIPTTRTDWESARGAMEKELGVDLSGRAEVGHVFRPTRPRSELVPGLGERNRRQGS